MPPRMIGLRPILSDSQPQKISVGVAISNAMPTIELEVVAVGHAILVTAYHLLVRKTTYRDASANHYDRRHNDRARQRAIQVLERQGYKVVLEPLAASA